MLNEVCEGSDLLKGFYVKLKRVKDQIAARDEAAGQMI